MASEQQHFGAARKFQAFYDDTLRKVGTRAPQPVLGQKVNDYRRETLRTIKRTFLPQNHRFYKMQMRRLPDDVLPGFEPQILQAAVDAANSPVGMAPGELRKIEEFDEYAAKSNLFASLAPNPLSSRWAGPVAVSPLSGHGSTNVSVDSIPAKFREK
jgi:hypothetical protein